MTTPAVATDDAPLLLCPACGFDLRGTPGDRCGECGLEIDRTGLRVSGLPWVHRRAIGRVRAYGRTLWQVALDRKVIRHEAAKPQEIADGRAFGRVTACTVALALLAAFGGVLHARGGLAFFALQPDRAAFGVPAKPAEPLLLDLAIPWSAGATLPGVLPGCLVLMAFVLAGVQRAVFRTPGLPTSHRERAVALSWYTTAPLVLLLPGVVCVWVSTLLMTTADPGPFENVKPLLLEIAKALLVAGVVLIVFAIITTPVRVFQWVIRTRHGGAVGATLALAEWVGLVLLGGGVLLGLLPWCAGCVWIAVDSFR